MLSTHGCDDEYEETVFLVELQGLFEKSAIEREVDQGRCRIGLLDSDQPLIQIGSNLFVGRWEPACGTDLLFREVPHRQMLSFVGSSEKRLIAQRVLLNSKTSRKRQAENEGEADVGGDDVLEPEKDTAMDPAESRQEESDHGNDQIASMELGDVGTSDH